MNNQYSLKKLLLYFLKLGTFGFGGSIALAHAMQKDLVKGKGWVTHEEFMQGLAFSQLAPGPLAAQLAMYIGFIKARALGAALSAIAFIFPSFIMVLCIAALYSRFGNLAIIQSLLYGIGAAIIGIIANSAYTLSKQTMKPKILLWIIYFSILATTLFTRSTNVLFFFLAGIICMIIYTKETLKISKYWALTPFLSSGTFSLISSLSLMKIFFFFLVAGSIAFGGGFAIIPYLQHGVVQEFHWLSSQQFVDAISVAMITPGPVVIAATFIGFFAGSFPGAVLATIAIFLPIYLIVVFLTPIFIHYAKHQRMIAFIEGITAAAMGSIVGSVFLLGETAVKDIATLLLAIFAFIGVKYLKIPGVIVVVIAGLFGLVLRSH